MRGNFTVISTEEIRFRGGRRALSVTLDAPYLEVLVATRRMRGQMVAVVTRSGGKIEHNKATVALVHPIDAPAMLSFAELGANDIAPGDRICLKIADAI